MNRITSRLAVLALGLATLLCAACAGPKGRVPDEHIVMINYRGNPVDPSDHPVLNIGHYREVEEAEFDKHVDQIVGHIDEYAQGFPGGVVGPTEPAQEKLTDVSKSLERMLARQSAAAADAAARGKPAPRKTEVRPRVVIFIHGGLNTQTGSVVRATELTPKLLADGVYPLFVNWQSSLFSSYWDHLFLVRYGEENARAAWLTAPFVVTADLLRAIGRAPLTIYSEVAGAFRSTRLNTLDNQRIGDRLADQANNASDGLDADFPETHKHPGTGAWTFTRDVVLMIPHRVLGVLMDLGGTSSWEVMHRRTTLVMEPEQGYRTDSIDRQPAGARPRFLTELRREQGRLNAQGIDLQVDLVGHSMGCIISNLILGTTSDARGT